MYFNRDIGIFHIMGIRRRRGGGGGRSMHLLVIAFQQFSTIHLSQTRRRNELGWFDK